MDRFVIPEYPDRYRDVPFSFDLDYKAGIDRLNKSGKPSPEILDASPVLLRVPGAPEAAAHYAADGTPLQASPENPAPAEGLESGRYYTEIGSAHIEAFLHKGTRDYLYVFLDGARTRNQGRDLAPLPSFLRWSWYQFTAASVLCLEDPMYYTYSGLKLGWFYGTETEDYAEYCAMLIRHIAVLLDVPLPHVILYGPSGGGHAVISMSAFIPGCMAVTVNGQYDITLHDYYLEGHFPAVTGLSASGPEGLARNRPAEIIREHPENHYLLICNMLSDQDFSGQLRNLCEKLDIIPQYGLKTFGHLTVWLTDARGVPEPHNAWENDLQFRMIDILLPNLINGCDAREICQYGEVMNRYWKERYDFLAKIRRLETALENRPEAAPAGLLKRILSKLKRMVCKSS